MPIWSPAMIFGSASSGYVVEDSCWFNGTSDRLTFDPSGASGTPDLYCLSYWAKRAKVGGSDTNVISGGVSGYDSTLRYTNYSSYTDAIQFYANGGPDNLITNAAFRDPTAWHHVFARYDSNASGGSSDYMQLWVNGVRLTSFASSSMPSAGENSTLFDGNIIAVGGYNLSATQWFDGYLAEVAASDGQDHAATDFGEYDDNGVWIPKDPSGLSYGTNGFLLQFKQTGSSQNASGIGADTSGNDNHFAIAGGSPQSNQVTDTCTDDADNNIGNYWTLNPLQSNNTLTGGNLAFTGPTNYSNYSTAPALPMTGKWYWEIKAVGSAPITSSANWDTYVGVLRTDVAIPSGSQTSNANIWVWGNMAKDGSGANGQKHNNSSVSFVPAVNFGNNSIMMIAVDMDNSKIYFGNDGTWAGSADPAAGSNPAFTSSDSSFGSHQVMPYQTLYADSATYNFGATAFAHTPPTGFKALNTANLPAPTVTDPSDFFTAKTLVNGGTPNTSFDTGLDSIGLIMAKRTDDTGGWEWIDIARGANALLQTNNNDDEVGKSGLSFSGGTFNITTTLNLGQANTSHIVYSLKAGGSPSTLAVDSISSGVPSIASSVSAASHGGFSVGTYTGDGGTSAKTVRHGLSRKPSWVIVKMRSGSGTQTWTTWQENIYAGDSDGYIILSDIAAPTDGASFNGVDVTDEVFSVGNDATNQDGDTFCFWAFAKTPGLIGSGKYIGGGSVFPTIVIDDGASGFKPAWLMIRRIDAGDEWVVFDSTANPHNNAEKYVSMSYNDAQRTNAAAKVDLFSNGFRPTVNHARVNSGTYIYLAFAENPFGGDGVAQAKAR